MIKKAIENYSVDEMGNVYSRTGRILKCSVNNIGYKQIFAYKNSKLQRSYLVHRLVWMAFNGDIPAGLEIDHIDRDKKNNCLSNLRLVTRSENMMNIKTRKGYCFHKPSGKWVAYIYSKGKRIHLGLHNTEEEAAAAYAAAKEKYHIIKIRG